MNSWSSRSARSDRKPIKPLTRISRRSAAWAPDAGSPVELLRFLQRTVGNAAVNDVLRRYDPRRAGAAAALSAPPMPATAALQRQVVQRDGDDDNTITIPIVPGFASVSVTGSGDGVSVGGTLTDPLAAGAGLITGEPVPPALSGSVGISVGGGGGSTRASPDAEVTEQSRSDRPAARSQKAEGVLARGSTGPAVAKVQRLLNDFGLLGRPLKVDGIFGRDTEFAVVGFQLSQALTPDGVVDDETLSKLSRGAALGGASDTRPVEQLN